MINILKTYFCIALCLTFASGILLGQGNVGTLNGTILDSTGALIPGATVVALNSETGIENRTSTTSAGAYTLPYLPSGTYTIRVSSPGFRTINQENIILRVGQVMTVNITMELGAVAEEVTVSAAPPLLESGTAEIGRYINNEEFQNWPIMVADGQRQIQSFIFSSLPGTTGGEFEGSINGGQQYSHEILIEGIAVGRMDLSGGNNNEMSPSAEAVSDFKLQSGAMGAQYNGGQTAVANFNIKSGTNELHGTVFYYGQNEAFNANTYSNSSNGIDKKSPFRQHNYGYSVGGPVYIPKVYDGRNKTFFFTNFEQTERSSFNISGFNTTLPTEDFKRGDFSRLFNPSFTGNSASGTMISNSAGQQALHGQIYDPLSTATDAAGNVVRDAFAGNIIPQSRISNVASNVINSNGGIVSPDLDQMVRNTGSVGGCCPFFDLYTIGVKGDHQINDSHRVSGLYNHEYRIRNNSPGGRYLPVPGLPTGVYQDQYTPSRMIRLSLNSTISPTVLNRLAGGYNRFRNSNESVYVDEGWAEKIGVQNTSPSHYPRMNFSGNEWQGGETMQIGSSSAGEGFNGSYIVQDDLTIIRGAHTIKVGYEYRKYWMNSRSKNGSGNFNFSPNQTMLPGFSGDTGNSFASFYLGAVNSASRGVSTLYSGHRHPSHGFYFADDWKVTPKLTLNLGLRWEIIQSFYEVTDRMSFVDLDMPNPGAEGQPGAIRFDKLKPQDTYWGMIGPRLGLAYRVNDKMVIRAGYGLTNMPPIRNDWGFGGFTTGYSASIPINSGTSPTGFVDDPSHWLDNPYPDLNEALPNTDPDQQLYTGRQTTSPKSTRLPYVQNWNATVQYQLPSDFVFEAAYIGNKGTRLWHSYFRQENVLPTSFLALGDMLRDNVGEHPELKPYASYPDDRSVAQALTPYPQYNNVTEAYPYNSNSSYHSAQFTLTRHFSGGLGILAAYTWSKTVNQSDAALIYDWRGATQDYFNRGLERAVSVSNIPHTFRLTWLYELPFGAGKKFDANSGLNHLIGGWTLSGIHQYRAGSPISVGQGGLSTPAGFGSMRPDVTGASQTLGGAPNDLDFFNGTPYLSPGGFEESPRTDNGVPIRVGTAPRNLPNVRGPHSSSERFRIVKVMRFNERFSFEFGCAMTNPLNRHGRGFVSTNVSSGSFGQLRINGSGQRVIQLEGRFAF
jgi:carboxypeptidase family protein/TonB-dependent receptor-like protein